ncbi:hypothetical protein AA14337_0141 [Acetobacter malorum DSM 14337]|uniref:Uncharacterized protein n=1 Tax=Acetobacter malorum DSM 14337 TaxID=1307910 RepID=A0ABQ0PM09_9PROT|nr:hypothetical protein AA14337_0141 [Acetobacter malorum DSM 14337]
MGVQFQGRPDKPDSSAHCNAPSHTGHPARHDTPEIGWQVSWLMTQNHRFSGGSRSFHTFPEKSPVAQHSGAECWNKPDVTYSCGGSDGQETAEFSPYFPFHPKAGTIAFC